MILSWPAPQSDNFSLPQNIRIEVNFLRSLRYLYKHNILRLLSDLKFYISQRNIQNSESRDVGYKSIITIICTLHQQIIKKIPSKKHKWPRHCVGVFYCHFMISAILEKLRYSQRLSKNPKSMILTSVSY